MARGVPGFSGSAARRRRRATGLTADQLGLRLGVTEQTVYRWERGQAFPTAEHLQALAELLEVAVADLVFTRAGRERTLRDLRHLQGLSIQAAAERTSISVSGIVRLERGVAALHSETSATLATAYEVSTAELQSAHSATQVSRTGRSRPFS